MGKDNGKDKGNDKRKGKDMLEPADSSNKDDATTPTIMVTGPADSSNKDDVEPATKRRKIAALSVTMLMYVPDDKAHLVSKDKFDKWNKDVVKAFEDSVKKIDVHTAKFLKAVPIGIHAPVFPSFWRNYRMDRNRQ